MTLIPPPSPSTRQANRAYWNQRRQSFLEDYNLSHARRAEDLEQMPQGAATGALSTAWGLLLIERTNEAHDCARFACQAADLASERKHFFPFFAPRALSAPHLRRLNDLSGQMTCLRLQFFARWIMEEEPPLDVLHQSLDVWRPARNEKPQ